jgi:hypothetical protein
VATAFTPQSAIEGNFFPEGANAQNVNIFFMDSTVTTANDTWATTVDLPGLLATSINAGAWPWKKSADGNTLELSLPGATWTSASSYSITFRWIVFTIYGTSPGHILAMVDMGSTRTLSSAQLQINATESTYIPGSYPIYRIRK